MNFAEELKSILGNEDKTLDQILNLQKTIRKDVTERDWEKLESNITLLNQWNEAFLGFDEQKNELIENAISIYSKESVSEVFKAEPLVMQVNRKLRISKLENDSLNIYVSITRNFLQSVFEKVVPGARNTLYSSDGTIIRSAPSSIILNTVG